MIPCSFSGCGLLQTLGITIVFVSVGIMFMAYRATEVTHILREFNRWKELSIKRVEYEMTTEQKMAELQFDLDVDLDKLKEEHLHREKMEIIEAKKELTREFIEKNTRSVITTSLTWMGTETEEVSQTIFSEEDIAFFQNNILYYGFDSRHAIDAPQSRVQGQIEEKGAVEMEEIEIGGDGEEIHTDKDQGRGPRGDDVEGKGPRNDSSDAAVSGDSFDAI